MCIKLNDLVFFSKSSELDYFSSSSAPCVPCSMKYIVVVVQGSKSIHTMTRSKPGWIKWVSWSMETKLERRRRIRRRPNRTNLFLLFLWNFLLHSFPLCYFFTPPSWILFLQNAFLEGQKKRWISTGIKIHENQWRMIPWALVTIWGRPTTTINKFNCITTAALQLFKKFHRGSWVWQLFLRLTP